MTEQQRIIELESRLTHLDDTVDQLNTIVSEQQLTLSKLEKLVRKLVDEHLEMKEQMAPDIVHTPPPHY